MTRAEALDLALALAAVGVPVFPIAISWDELALKTNKRPLTANGFYNASTDPDEVRAMFANARTKPGEVVGVGAYPGPAGFVVLDVDVKGGHRGDVELAELEARYGELPPTVHVITASNGEHVWLRKGDAHVGNRDLVDGEIEVRSDAGYVVAPGTVTPWGSWELDGGGAFDPTLVADWPDWVPTMLGVTVVADLPQAKAAPSSRWRAVVDTDLHPADLAALQALRKLGGHSEYVGSDGSLCIVRPGKTAGASASVGHIAPGVVKVFTSSWSGLPAGRYDADELVLIAGGATVEEARAAFSPVPATGSGMSTLVDKSDTPGSHVGGFPVLIRVGNLARMVDQAERKPDVVRGLIAAGDYGTFGATKKFGKTWLANDLSVNVAAGGRFLGHFPVDLAGTVLLFAGEGGARKITRRSRAVAGFYGYDHDRLNLFVAERVPKLRNDTHISQLDAVIAEYRPVLTIIDPAYLAISGANKDDVVGVGELLERAHHVAQAYGSALLFMHHWNKTGTGTDADRITGSGFAEWSRFLASGSAMSKQVDPVTKRSDLVGKVEWIGDETADLAIHYRRAVWVDGDPDDRYAPMRYEVAVVNAPEVAPSDDPTLQQLTPATRRVLDALRAEPGVWMTKHDLGDRLARTGFPLKSRTILDACRAVAAAGLVESFTGPTHNDPTSWRAAA